MAAAAARWPLIAALSIVAGSPVSIQSPASSSPSTAVCVPGRRGWPGASENDARRSRTTTARVIDASRRAGSDSASSRRAIAVISSLPRAARSSAPLETSERWVDPLPNNCCLSNTHCIARPGRPMNASPSTRRSSHTFTVTMADGAVAAAASMVCRSAVIGGSTSGSACHATATMTTRGLRASSRSRTMTSPPASSTRAREPVSTVPPRACRYPVAGCTNSSSSGTSGSPSAESRRSVVNIRRST